MSRILHLIIIELFLIYLIGIVYLLPDSEQMTCISRTPVVILPSTLALILSWNLSSAS